MKIFSSLVFRRASPALGKACHRAACQPKRPFSGNFGLEGSGPHDSAEKCGPTHFKTPGADFTKNSPNFNSRADSGAPRSHVTVTTRYPSRSAPSSVMPTDVPWSYRGTWGSSSMVGSRASCGSSTHCESGGPPKPVPRTFVDGCFVSRPTRSTPTCGSRFVVANDSRPPCGWGQSTRP